MRANVLVAISFAFPVFASTALAQEAVELDAVTVTTSKTPKKVVNTAAPASARGSSGSVAQPVETPSEPFPASTVSATGFGANGKSSFDQIQPGSVSDIVRGIPGVTTSISPQDPAQSINIRGLQDFGRVNVLVDGARQNFQRSGHNANGSFYLEPEFLTSVDVTRGPSSTVYGSGAIGGVAAFRTRGIDDILREDETSAIVQKLGIGSNGAGFLSSTSGGMRVGPNVDIFGQFVSRDTSPYENGAGQEVFDSGADDYGGLGKIAIRPAAGHEITASALVQRFDFVSSLRDSANSPSPTTRQSDVEAETYTLGYTYSQPSNPLIDFSAKAYYTTTKTDQDELFPDPEESRFFEIETTGADIHNTSRFKTASVGHSLTYGIDGFQDKVNVIDVIGTADLFTPSGERTVFGAFIQDEVQLTPWLKVIGALRYDNYELEGQGTSRDGDRISPKGTVSVTPFAGIEVYGTYAEGYRAPSLTETIISGTHPPPAQFAFLPNSDLNPEVGKNKEIGVNLQYNNVLRRGDKFRGKVSVFRNDIEDYIDLREFGGAVPLDPCPVPGFPILAFPGGPVVVPCPATYQALAQYQNISNARIEGFEFEFGYDWGDGFTSIAGTFTDGEDVDTGLGLVTVPPDRVTATIGLRLLNKRMVVGARVHAVDHSDTDIGDLGTFFATDGYTLLDLFGSYQLNDWSAVDVAINNVTDVRYRKYLDQDDSPGLQAKAALTVKFGGGDGLFAGQ